MRDLVRLEAVQEAATAASPLDVADSLPYSTAPLLCIHTSMILFSFRRYDECIQVCREGLRRVRRQRQKLDKGLLYGTGSSLKGKKKDKGQGGLLPFVDEEEEDDDDDAADELHFLGALCLHNLSCAYTAQGEPAKGAVSGYQALNHIQQVGTSMQQPYSWFIRQAQRARRRSVRLSGVAVGQVVREEEEEEEEDVTVSHGTSTDMADLSRLAQHGAQRPAVTPRDIESRQSVPTTQMRRKRLKSSENNSMMDSWHSKTPITATTVKLTTLHLPGSMASSALGHPNSLISSTPPPSRLAPRATPPSTSLYTTSAASSLFMTPPPSRASTLFNQPHPKRPSVAAVSVALSSCAMAQDLDVGDAYRVGDALPLRCYVERHGEDDDETDKEAELLADTKDGIMPRWPWRWQVATPTPHALAARAT